LLFRFLHDDAFLAFSREHKHLYAECLLSLYERYFTGAPAFPTPQEVTHVIYDVMRANPSFWHESDDFGQALPEVISAGRRRLKRASASKTETSDKALLIARQIYGRLTAWGWLEEEEYGLRVTVDMSMGPLLVIQRLASLNKDVSQRFGGLIVTVRLNLEAVEKLNPLIVDRKQREVALALREARNQVDQFTKSLRAILSDLKRIRRTVMESKTVGDRLEAFFEEFVGQLLLKDFESILTFNHPYRFRDAIVDLAKRIITDFHSEEDAKTAEDEFNRVFREKQAPDNIQKWMLNYVGKKKVARVLVDAELAPSMAEARRLIEQGGVRINDEKITQTDAEIEITKQELLIQVGKRRFLHVRGWGNL